MKGLWSDYWFGTTDASRPALLIRGVLLILAFDTWVELVSHGGRYGHGGFNVAHFGVLDAIQPLPTPSLYVGLVILVGLLAFASAVGRLYRLVLALIALLYTWAWAMSMIDSYQHHYLLSLVLGLFALMPLDREGEAFPELAGQKTSGWSWHLLSVSVALVYVWTMVSKLEPDWRNGAALERIAGEELRAIHDWLDAQPETFDAHLRLISPSVAVLQLVIAVGYLAAPLATRSKLARIGTTVGWVGAVTFHAGAEWLGLEIGWFSGYMLFIASVVLLPGAVIDAAAQGLSLPRQLGRRYFPGLVFPNDAGPLAFSFALGAGAILLTVGTRIDLPGAFTATAVLAAALLGASLSTLRLGLTARAVEGAAAATLAAVALWSSVTFSETRFDFYRFLGGAHWRMGAWQDALTAYEKSNRYAPEGKDRRRAEREAREHAARGGPRGTPD